MSESESQTWNHLGYIVAIYITTIIGYSIYLNQPFSAQFSDLVKDIPDYLAPQKEFNTKISIVEILFYVFIQTVPLVISAFLVVYFTTSEGLNLFGIAASIVIPFMIYFWIVDQNVIATALGTSQAQLLHGHNPPMGAGSVVTAIMGYYFVHYKLPLTLAAVLLGGYGGYTRSTRL